MFEMKIGDKEFTPVGIGASLTKDNDQDALVVQFNSSMDMKEVVEYFNQNMTEETVVSLKNEKREQGYSGYRTIKNEVSCVLQSDGTYNYMITLLKPSTLDIALKNKADIEYMAVMSNVDIEA